MHKGSLGPKCADCHTENDWKEAKFDHDKTRFALKGKHVDTKCVDCHKKGADYKDAPRTCIGCHKKDDDGSKGHKGLYGEKCDSCHGAKAWKPSTFNHDTDTKYALRGKHRTTKCADCHTGHLYKDKRRHGLHRLPQEGRRRARATRAAWAATAPPATSRAAGRKRASSTTTRPSSRCSASTVDAKCADCHKSTNYKEAPKDCFGCHKKDDKHEATLGTKCEACHVERDWKTTQHALRPRQDAVSSCAMRTPPRRSQCKDCHIDLKHYRDTPMDCYACHKKDDKHEGQQGTKCDTCHSDRDWKVDHASTTA